MAALSRKLIGKELVTVEIEQSQDNPERWEKNEEGATSFVIETEENAERKE